MAAARPATPMVPASPGVENVTTGEPAGPPDGAAVREGPSGEAIVRGAMSAMTSSGAVAPGANAPTTTARSSGAATAHYSTLSARGIRNGQVADASAIPSAAELDRLRPHAHEGAGPHGGRFPSIVDAIGHTPLVEIPRMCPNGNVRLYAKLEFMNPTGSVKDRIAKYLIEDLERSGRLTPESIIIEPTSGNTGIALAMIARRKGYRVAVVMPDNVTNERRQLLALFGAEIIDSPGAKGSNGAVELAKYLVGKDPRFVMPYQYGNPANPQAHYETTAEEIIADCPEVDVFVAGLGTGGTLTGVGRRLREHNPDVRIYAAEPLPGENVQGLRSLEEGFVPEVFDPSTLDGKYLISNADSVAALRALTEREGIFAGVSSGGALVAAARVAREMEHGTIVVLLADGGWKYLSGGVWTRELGEMETDLESRSWW